jgi:hypothetical protein
MFSVVVVLRVVDVVDMLLMCCMLTCSTGSSSICALCDAPIPWESRYTHDVQLLMISKPREYEGMSSKNETRMFMACRATQSWLWQHPAHKVEIVLPVI